MDEQYIYDETEASFKKEPDSKWKSVRKIVRIALAFVTISVIYYMLFALIFTTSTERELKRENRALAEAIPVLEEKERLISDVISGLNIRDNAIYEDIFKTSAPRIDPMSSHRFTEGRTDEKLDRLMRVSQSVEANFREIAGMMDSSGFEAPPMQLPLKNVSYAQVGASVGMKMNPFYKVPLMHEGLDIIASPGDPVYAAAVGTVSDVTRSRKGLGNVVTIRHKDGYVTRYAHLGDIYVESGASVRRGQKIGSVGAANNGSYAPHLHYAVRKDTVYVDPVHYFYASVGPEDYTNMLITSALTGQSMD